MSDQQPNITEELARKAVTVQAWFAKPIYRTPQSGDVHGVEFHCSAEDWYQFIKTHPRNVEVTLTFWQTEDEEAIRHEAEKKAKPEKGPHGALWQSLFAQDIPHITGVRERIQDALNAMGDDAAKINFRDRAKVALRAIFGVDSLTKVSGDDVRAMFPGNDGVGICVDNAENYAADKARHKEKEAA